MSKALLACEGLAFSYLDRFPRSTASRSTYRGERLALSAPTAAEVDAAEGARRPAVPVGGRYRAFGQDVTEAHLEDEQFSIGFRSRIGFVFQSSDAQVFSPTVREEVAFGPLQLGLPPDAVRERIADVLGMLGITRLADRAPHQLSGGERKRVAIASVLATNPEVLLFDEPTAGLDPRTQAWLLELIGELHRAGKTIVCATHDLHALEWIADRCAVFSEDHRIVLDGTPEEVLADHERLVELNLVYGEQRKCRLFRSCRAVAETEPAAALTSSAVIEEAAPTGAARSATRS